ncbi:MAG: grpE [Verrucomicrobia bacterium]|nr:grpE [Verrucomicrobiota bacterium]
MTRRERSSGTPHDHGGGLRTADGMPSAVDELALLAERYQRLAADFENFRKRTARDAERTTAARNDALLRELLPIADNLERALASHPSTKPEQLRGGIELTQQQLAALLKRHGVEADDNVGEAFDPHRHEAISARFVAGEPDHVVVEVMQRGYRRGNEIIRPAQVIVNDLELADPDANGG